MHVDAITSYKRNALPIKETLGWLITSIASSCQRYKWKPSMGTATPISVWDEPFSTPWFWCHSSFKRLTTSCATVDFPAPGGPAIPTMYLQITTSMLISVTGRLKQVPSLVATFGSPYSPSVTESKFEKQVFLRITYPGYVSQLRNGNEI